MFCTESQLKKGRVYTLENWNITTANCGSFQAHGKVYKNPKFKKETDIYTSTILEIESEEAEYLIHTLNSVYRLPMESYVGNEDMQTIVDDFYAQNRRAMDCAEKLLSEGDCLFFNYKVFYNTGKGIISLPFTKPSDTFYVKYIYADNGFELYVYDNGYCTVEFDENHRKCALYKLAFYGAYITKSDYIAIDTNTHNDMEIYNGTALPF